MKILLSTPFDFACPGGVNDHLVHLDRELQRQGHITRILSPRASSSEPGDDGHIVRIGRSIPLPANGSTARMALSPLINRQVRDFLEREQFDVIHLQEPITPMLHLTVLYHSRAVNIGTFHASHRSRFGYNLCYLYGKFFLFWFMNRLDVRVAVSGAARDFVERYYPGSYRIIPNGIDVEAFGPDIEPVRGFGRNPATVLFVGRYNEPRKGFSYMLQAMARLQQDMPDARLLVVGPGNEEYYRRAAGRIGVRNLIFAGAVPTEQLPGYYAACDVFCAPSTGRESFGIVLLEGMASGKPVVATDIDGYRSVVRHGREGLLVPPRDPDSLASALQTVLADSSLQKRLGMAGRVRSQEFSWPAVARRVVECYRQASERRRYARVTSPASPSLFESTRRT